MNKLVSSNITAPLSVSDSILSTMSNWNSKSMLILGGMVCLTVAFCVRCACLSGSEMTLSKDGLSITQPHTAT